MYLNPIIYLAQQIVSQAPSMEVKQPTIEEAFDSKKPGTNFETCLDPRWGEKVEVPGKGKGQLISTAVVVLKDSKGEVVGYYTGYSPDGIKDVAGVFFDKTGRPVATLGKPGENILGGKVASLLGLVKWKCK